ncbi:hypothetical protein H072_3581 [Dactylellina haptotyla CBS 200.50]|uniref:Uncharacterized protein n=1 Tax=Dactylellina haptotyla (strain CBS 200.50) TaxID=1284197 RepID=S8AHF5_DACHA|nr:hypothetical protein H072_3581 [Dactylellina haptotyla CBS 200.50]
MSSSAVKPFRKRKASSLREDVPAKLPKCSPRTSKIRRDAFFAGARRRSERRREPLSEISITNELPTSPSVVPSSSPPPLFSSSPLKHQLLTPAWTPDVTFLKKLQISRGNDGGDFGLTVASRLVDDFQDIRKPKTRKPMPTSFSFRNLNRTLVGYEPDDMHGIRLGRRTWVTEGFYSEQDDIHVYNEPDAGPQMPFCLATFNTTPMVAIGYESGGLRLVGTGPWDENSILEKGGYIYNGFNKESASVLIHDNAIFDLSLSADDRFIASASGDQTCRVNDIETQQPVAVLSGHRGSVKQINHSLDNYNLLLTSSRDSDVHIWDLRTAGISLGENQGRNQKPINSIFGGHTVGDKVGSVTSAVWSTRNPYQIATASHNDAVIKIWDIRKSHYLKKSANSRPIVECEAPKPKFHDFKPHRDHGITSLTFSPDGSRLYALCKDGNVYAYSTSHMHLGPIHFYSHAKLKTNSFYVKSSVSRDGEIIATGSTDGTVVLFATDEKYLSPVEDDGLPVPHGAPASVTAAKDLMSGKGTALIEGHGGKEVTNVAWDVNRNVVSISDDCVARIWRDDDYGARAEQLRQGDWLNGERHGCGWSEGD